MNEINQALDELKRTSGAVPQPEGGEVANAYKFGLLSNHSTTLHVLAIILRQLRDSEKPK